MSNKTHGKKAGRRKAKKAVAMRADELRRHAESGRGYSVSRGAPHVGHTPHKKASRVDHAKGLGRNWLSRSR